MRFDELALLVKRISYINNNIYCNFRVMEFHYIFVFIQSVTVFVIFEVAQPFFDMSITITLSCAPILDFMPLRTSAVFVVVFIIQIPGKGRAQVTPLLKNEIRFVYRSS